MPRAGHLNTRRKWGDIMHDLLKEFELWGVDRKEILLPILAKSEDEVKVEFAYKGAYRPITCSRFSHDYNGPARNLAAIVSVIKSARLADQRGIGQVLADMSSLLALPDPSDPHTVLGVTPDWKKDDIRTQYRDLIKKAHPDIEGGDVETFKRIVKAGKGLGVS